MDEAVCFFVEFAEWERWRIEKVLQLSYAAVCKQIGIKVNKIVFTGELKVFKLHEVCHIEEWSAMHSYLWLRITCF